MKNNECRVAIIGGGLSGLVIAEGLKQKGYEHVTVFEKEGRVGGKLHTICYRGKSYELGANFGLPSHIHLKALMKKFHIKTDRPKLSRVNYDANGQKVMPIPKEELEDFVGELSRLPDALAIYPSLDDVNIHKIEPSLMLPFSMWCDIHEFRVLKTIYVHYFTIFGLGDIKEVPALYVLRILNYQHLMSFMELPAFSTWEDGVSSLIECLKQEIKDIRLEQKVTNISFSKHDTLMIQTEFEVTEFDRVIITAPLEQFSDCHIIDTDMKQHLSAIQYQSFNVYAMIGEKIPKGCGCMIGNLSSSRNGHMIIFDSRWDEYDGEGMVMVYAYDPPDHHHVSALDLIKNDLLKLGVKNPRLYQAKRWRHCPYVDTQALENGFYDKIESMQGKNNIFMAGEIMSTLSMENSIRYSEDLVHRFF